MCWAVVVTGNAEAAAQVFAWGDTGNGQCSVPPSLNAPVAAGAAPLTYQWLKEDAAIVGANDAALVLERVRTADAGAYTVLVSNTCGLVTSAAAVLRVNERLPLLLLTDVWKYDQSGLDLGTAWKETNYNDSAWSQGAGVLAVEDNPAITPLIRTTLALSNAARERILTYYFRTHLSFNEDPSTVYLTASNLVDDGAVIYLHGWEIYRLNMADAPVHAATLALLPAEEVFTTVNFPATGLIRGDNLLAVEVHQVTTNSSDVDFGLALDVQSRVSGVATVVVQPKGQCVSLGSNVLFNVVAAGEEPLRYQWQKSGVALAEDGRVQGVTTPHLSIANVEIGDLGDYAVWVQNARGETVTQPAALWLTPPCFRWAQSAGGISAEDTHDAAVDRWGNVYVAGRFNASFSWDGNFVTSKGTNDVCLAKYDRTGLLQWVQTAGGTGNDYGCGVAVDADGDCYLSGQFSGSASFGNTILTSAGGHDVFVAKYRPDGTLLWVRQAGGSGADQCWSVAVDRVGSCYITGNFNGTATFGSKSLTSAGSSDLFLARYDASGDFQWALRGGGTGADCGAHVAVDPAGAAHVAGWFTGSATFSGRSLTSAGGTDVLVAKYSSGGTLAWAQTAGGTRSDVGKSIAVDTNGNSYVLAVLDANEARQPPRLRVAQYDADGFLRWEREAFGGFYSDHCSIATDNRGCYLTGGFEGTAIFGQATLIGTGALDVFAASYDAQGALHWVQRAGGPTADFGAGIAASEMHGIYLCGWFTGKGRFGTNLLTSNGSQDLFVARIGDLVDPSGLRFDAASWRVISGELRLCLRGLTGADSVIVEASTNLLFWEPILTNRLPNDPLEFTIPIPADWPSRFFRAIVPPN